MNARVALFLLVGVAFFLRWRQVGSVDYQDPETLDDWLAVVGFSVALVLLAASLPLYAELADRQLVSRVALVPAIGCALAGVSNILEDGVGWAWMFWGFVISTLLTTLGLLALTLVTAATGRGSARLLCVVPGLTLAGVLLFEAWGGILMLTAWTTAAIVTFRMQRVRRLQGPHSVPEW